MRYPILASINAGHLALALIVLTVAPAWAGTVFNVDTLADLADDNLADTLCHTNANTCSLRAAISQSNNLAGTGTTLIQVPPGTYVLSIDRLYVGSASHPGRSSSISGAGAARRIR